MAHRFTFEAVNKSFRDITQIDKPFGGIIFIIGGDFRKILPVVIRGTCGQIIDACIKSSDLWKYVNVMHLTVNMRIQQQQDYEQQEFVNYLLQIDKRKKELLNPDIGEDIVKLQDYINYNKNRAILTIRNENIDDINEQIINIFSGQAQEFLLADSVEDKNLVH